MIIKKNQVIYYVVVNVSRSGMSRDIMFLVVDKNEIINISFDIAETLNWTKSKHYLAVKVRGCGMDMAFHTVYEYSQKLFNNGYLLKSRSLT